MISIDHREHRVDTKGRPFTRTYLTTDDGSEAQYWGEDVEVGTEVEVFLDHRWDTLKARKPSAARPKDEQSTE